MYVKRGLCQIEKTGIFRILALCKKETAKLMIFSDAKRIYG